MDGGERQLKIEGAHTSIEQEWLYMLGFCLPLHTWGMNGSYFDLTKAFWDALGKKHQPGTNAKLLLQGI